MSKKQILLIVLIISAMTLQLEFLQTRIFSFALWFHFVYVVITMALLGFAASGTALSISPQLKRMTDQQFFLFCMAGFSVSSVFVSRFAFLPVRNVFTISPDIGIIVNLIITYTISMVPYFFSGLIIGGAFVRRPASTSTLYFVNLLGSGLGCLSFVFLITPLGAIRLLLVTSLVSLIPLIIGIRKYTLLRWMVMPWAVFLVWCMFLNNNSLLYKIKPEPHKQICSLLEGKTTIEYSQWNPVSRIDVISSVTSPGMKFIVMDGDAEAKLFPPVLVKYIVDNRMLGLGDRNAVYAVLGRPPHRTLVIGAGGGFDVLLACSEGAGHVDAVEINPTTADIAKRVYADHIDRVFSNPGVKLFNEDGRSFVRRSREQYDTIVMCATDSMLALSTGAYVLLDNYLYTKEAFEDYFKRLSDDGLMQICRWHFPKFPRETLRVFSTSMEALRTIGVSDPTEQVIVFAIKENWGDIIVKKTPFSKDEIGRVKRFCDQRGYDIIFSPQIYKNRDITNMNDFVACAHYFMQGREKAFYDGYPYNVNPVSDDSPFFYQFNKFNRAQDLNSQHRVFDRVRGVWHIFVLSSLLIHTSILSFILVLLPLIIWRRRLGKVKVNIFTAVYFFSIGIGFMFLQMGIVQKFVLFVGSPIYSMAVIVPCLLIFAGLGSLASERIKTDIRRYMIGATLTSGAMILILTYLIPVISDIFLMQPIFMRIIVVVITLAPLAFCMGLPFPLALRAISDGYQDIVPWAWAVNGCASVIASILAVIVAMQSGFRADMLIAAFFYVAAGLLTVILLKGRRVL